MRPRAIEESGIRGIASRHGYRVESLQLSLFDLDVDPGEKTNVAELHPEIVQSLLTRIETVRADLGDSLTRRQGDGVRPLGQAP